MATLATLLLGANLPIRADDQPDAAGQAQRLALRGKRAEAAEAFRALAPREPIAAALGIARLEANEGNASAARQTLTAAAAEHPDAVALWAELARLEWEHDRWEQADQAVERALALEQDHLLARWIQAERHRAAGRLDEADAAYHWFVKAYNERDLDRPEDLHLVALAAAQYARWHRLSDQFSFLINDLYPEILEQDADFWPAHHESGRLFLEKYNEPEARKAFQAALRINVNAAEVYASLAELAMQNFNLDEARRAASQALEIQPGLLSATLALADAHLANFETREALRLLETARETYPRDERLLGRLAATFALLDGLGSDGPAAGEDSQLTRLMAEVAEQNPRCGEFYHTLAATFELTRKYPLAARYWREAIERMPQLVAPSGQLGLVAMRLGREDEARRLLAESFERDPFNVRVSNSLKVLEVLDDYAVLETEHFILRFDRGRDALLARQAARYLEDHVYPTLVRHFDFEPREKSLFEIFQRAKNTSGHGWFSARMVGLPYVGTVGACAGQMVALASPNDMPKPYNWARVLKHEFVHVLNLQQTDFRIPHWYTEALAVESEGYPRPASWDTMLIERVPAGRMFHLDNINLGFVRPKTGEDWQMAYCQAQLYAQFMLERYGADALAKMLRAYADNCDTRTALQRCFNAEQADFERDYRTYVEQLVAGLQRGRASAESRDPVAILKAWEAQPDDVELTAQVALLRLGQEKYPEARKLAESVRQREPRHAQASYVLARVRLLIGEEAEARRLLEEALDESKPDPNVVNQLASLELQEDRFEAAARLYELGARHDPTNLSWQKALARVYLKLGDQARLVPVLERLAQADADDRLLRKKLAQLALEAGKYAAALDWAQQVLYIDAQDVDAYRTIRQAAGPLKAWDRGIEAAESLIFLEANDLESRFALAEFQVAAGRREAARETLAELLQRAPQHAAARKLQASLDP